MSLKDSSKIAQPTSVNTSSASCLLAPRCTTLGEEGEFLLFRPDVDDFGHNLPDTQLELAGTPTKFGADHGRSMNQRAPA